MSDGVSGIGRDFRHHIFKDVEKSVLNGEDGDCKHMHADDGGNLPIEFVFPRQSPSYPNNSTTPKSQIIKEDM